MMDVAPTRSSDRAYTDDDDAPGIRSADLAAALGLPFHDAEGGTVVVPRELYDSINETYAEVARWGFATERDFEQRLYQWLAGDAG